MMAPSAANYPNGLIMKVAAVTVIIIFLAVPSPKSVDGLEMSSYRKMVLGSRPPGCVNKCMSCRPCVATLFVPPHHHLQNHKGFRESFSSHGEDDSYYLLSWKCSCGNKLYQP